MGEALARCPDLELVVPDPDATAEAGERVLCALEDMGAAVEPVEPGVACFAAGGLGRLHGGLEGVLRRARAALPVGADGRLGAAPSRFAALQAAREAPSRRPLVLGADEVAAFLAPLPAERLPLEREALEGLAALGLVTMGQVAALPRAAVLDRFGRPGLRAWELARGGADRPLRPRRPPEPLEAAFRFPEPVGALPALEAAARLLLGELAGRARGRGRAVRALTLRARLADGGSWTRALTLREATADAARLADGRAPAPGRGGRAGGGAGGAGRRLGAPGRAAAHRDRDRAPTSAGAAPARPCARCGPPRGPRPSCAWSSSSPGRACPSGGGRSPPTTARRSAPPGGDPRPRPSGPSPAPGPSA